MPPHWRKTSGKSSYCWSARARPCPDVIVAILNPKTALFYAALLPQFVDSLQYFTAQALMLSASARGLQVGRYAAAAMYAGSAYWPRPPITPAHKAIR